VQTAGVCTAGEAQAEALACRLRQVAAGTKGTFAFYVHDLESGVCVAIRADESFPAASVIKLPILLRVLELVHAGEAHLDQPLRLTEWHKTGGSGVLQHFHSGLEVTLEDACTAMIALSDNTATNLVLDVTGIDPVNAMLDRRECPRTRLHRYFGKPEMPGPPGPSQAVPREIGRLLETLVGQDYLAAELRAKAVAMLRLQTHRALIPRLLPEGTSVAHKTGSLDGVRHDAGIIWRPRQLPVRSPKSEVRSREEDATGHPLVLVAMSRDVADRRWTVENAAERTIARAAKAVFDYFTLPLPAPPLPLPRRR